MPSSPPPMQPPSMQPPPAAPPVSEPEPEPQAAPMPEPEPAPAPEPAIAPAAGTASEADEDAPLWDADVPESGEDDESVELSAEDESALDDLGSDVPGESLDPAATPADQAEAPRSEEVTETGDQDSVESGQTVRGAVAEPEPQARPEPEPEPGPEPAAEAPAPVPEPEPERASEPAPAPQIEPEPQVTTPPAIDNPMADAAPPDLELEAAPGPEPAPAANSDPKPIVDAPDISLFDEPPAKAKQTGAHKTPPTWPPTEDDDAYKPGRARVKNFVEKADLPEHMPLPRPTVYGGPKPDAEEGE
ncbi:hypothetical protein GCM10029992_04990 [Glycomyces albus]